MEIVSPGHLGRRLAGLLLTVLAVSVPLAAQSPGRSYRIGPNDEIAIQVQEDEALNVTRRVSANGTVTLPLLGEIEVGNRTAREVSELLATDLERSFLQRATVQVSVREFRSQSISVLGAVRQPGTAYLTGRWSLFQALAAAGGLAEANKGVAIIRRRASNGLSDQLEIDLSELIDRGDQMANVPVFANDVINIPGAEDITVYFLGAKQGAVTFKATDKATLLTAIARTGGLGEAAAKRLIIRRNREGQSLLKIEANFKRILAGTDPDIELQDGDLILVKEAFL